MKNTEIQERILRPAHGIPVLILELVLIAVWLLLMIGGVVLLSWSPVFGVAAIVVGPILLIADCICFAGLKSVRPNEALVLTLFGSYHGTVKEPGFYFVNPFCSAVSPAYDKAAAEAMKKAKAADSHSSASTPVVVSARRRVSLKTMTLDNGRQKVNDVLGNPIIIGAVAIWRVVDPTRAVFCVDDYPSFLSIQTDSTIRNIARLYPYDIFEEDEDAAASEKSLRGSPQEIAESMKAELQKRGEEAGIVVEEVRLTHLAYAEEIAAAMPQRQQAAAIIAARQKIVDGAVGMVKMAIDRLEPAPGFALIDGNRDHGKTAAILLEHQTVVKGDSLSASIAAASILAKVSRDRYMEQMAERYPEYEFERHKGYGTKRHYELLRRYGPCPIHRRTFLKKL